ncbi:PREDICTED: pollen receptor kinase [Prunus dulcis]|uniref:PREDICTED: pollen receptor kinase n=1 Tax=Prunus dulcis TaxID=3755 RepID=A0A5E4E5E0_PRUDU|nr:pollen receptor-like kinase 3 [Prunus dulcis]KAI5320051.1 hypothetical protein L3X38_039759 [Prunus dulcis]VVA10199.1 PREDICTED: pollen receptor kinase [Prunus dulcis]
MAAVRFLFLLLFFSSSPYLSLSLPQDQEALLKFKKSLTRAGALDKWTPDQNSSPCKAQWTGIVCFKGSNVISGLHISNMGLSGKIDFDALKDIPTLRTINFMNNNFSGSIPDFHTLGALKSLLLSGNGFSGEIPKDYFSHMNSLKKIYLDNNNFTGKIPESLGQLNKLEELHLEKNQFTGSIPKLKQGLNSLDLSNNKLQGPIPDSMSKYNPKAFEGNEGLCGVPFKSSCKSPSPSPSPAPTPAPSLSPSPSTPSTPSPSPPPSWPSSSSSDVDSKRTTTIIIIISVILGIMILLLLYVLFVAKRRKRDDDFDVLGKEQLDDHHQRVVEVHVPSSNNRSLGSTNHSLEVHQTSSKKGDSKKGSNHGKNGMNELLMVNDEKGSFGLSDLMKAAAEVLGNGGLGSAYKAVMSNGMSVVVKRMRDMNRLGRDGFDSEMRRFGRLRHKNILTPLAYHYRREEKLLISEYIPTGSLLYLLHGDRGISHSELNWPIRLKIIQGIACGMGFIHTEFASYDLPHGNLKSSNVLLNDDYEPVLNDYALHPLINPNNAAQTMFAFRTPEITESQQISPKSDVYCLGILILEILTGKFPSQYLTNGKGGTDVVQWVQSAMAEQREEELLDPEIASDADSLDQMVQLLKIGADCTLSDPEQRLDIREAIRRIEEVQV